MNVIALPSAAIEVKDGHPVTSSQRVAEIFGKQHKNVIQRIEALIAECPEEFSRLNFQPAEYLDAQGKPRPAYDLSPAAAPNAFPLLAGFSGP